MTFVVSYWTLP